MTQAKHTPGPWTPEFGEAYRVRAQQDGGQVAIMMNLKGQHGLAGRRSGDEVAANARLISAGPELLDSHEPEREGADFLDWIADRLVNVYGESENVDFVICLRRRAVKARAAIAKATGT